MRVLAALFLTALAAAPAAARAHKRGHAHAAHAHAAHAHAAHAHAAHAHTAHASLPGEWFQPRGHPVEALFERSAAEKRAASYPPLCQQGLPNPDPTSMPLRWIAAYNAAKGAGLIPDIPPSVLDASGNPQYPAGVNAQGADVCSGTLKCRAKGDLWDAPPGVLVVSFDDGPVQAGPALYDFLHAHNVPSTHFMIGCEILGTPDAFAQAYGGNHASIAVHTWSHPFMTALSDFSQLAELGWTMQIISDMTGGRVPRYWRPPHGDCDNRCRAIATHVFGLTTVFWNQDSEDWRMSGGYPGAYVGGNITEWVTGAKSPGLMILEHELTPDTVNFFINTTYPLATTHNWTLKNVPQAFGTPFYQNAPADTGAVTKSGLIALAAPSSASTLPPFTPSSSTASTSSTASVASSTTASAASTVTLWVGAGTATGATGAQTPTEPAPLATASPGAAPRVRAQGSLAALGAAALLGAALL